MSSSETQELADRIARGGPQVRGQIRRMIGRLLRRHAASAKLFKGDDGQLRPEAVEWFDQLAQDNFVHGGGFDSDPLKMAANVARRDLVLKIIQSADLDVGRLASLKQLEREVND